MARRHEKVAKRARRRRAAAKRQAARDAREQAAVASHCLERAAQIHDEAARALPDCQRCGGALAAVDVNHEGILTTCLECEAVAVHFVQEAYEAFAEARDP